MRESTNIRLILILKINIFNKCQKSIDLLIKQIELKKVRFS